MNTRSELSDPMSPLMFNKTFNLVDNDTSSPLFKTKRTEVVGGSRREGSSLSPDRRQITEDKLESEREDSVASLEDIAEKRTEFKFSEISMGLKKTSSIESLTVDIPIYRDKLKNLKSMETVFGSIMMGCAMGQMCFNQKSDRRSMMYAAAAITDTYLITIRKQAIESMLDNQVRRV